MATKRRKVDVERRGFNDAWTSKYFFAELFGKPTCLICYASVAVNKEWNIRRPYETKHSKFSELDGQRRKDKIKQFKVGLEKQSTFFQKQYNETEKNTVASYEVAKLIAEHMKPFVDGEFVRKCLMTVVGIVCPEKEMLFSNISLSARTVTRRIEEMSGDVKRRQKDGINKLQFFSIAIDESTDATDTAQLAVFVRGVSEAFDIVEEFVQLVPMKGTTTGADILNALLLCIGDMDLDLSKMVSITTDGAPAMTGKNRGVSALLQQHIYDLGIDNDIAKIHCLIHQEALCAKALNFKDVMETVVKAVNVVLSQGLNHRQFRQLLSDAENEYGDLLYFCDVRWLSRGTMLGRVYALRNEIASFLESKNKNVTEFRDPKWLSELAFLVDLTSHLNKLNLQLQGKHQLVHEMWRHILAFERKLWLWEGQLEKANYAHFTTLQERKPTSNIEFVSVIRELRNDFSSRFADVRSLENEFKLFSTPFDVNVDTVAENIQMEFLEMQCNEEMKSIFYSRDVSLLDFYKKYLLEGNLYPNLTNHAKKITSMFGSTYACEQLFSKMNITKNKLRTRISDAHLENVLILASSSVPPDVEKLSSLMQGQVSH